MWVCCSNKYDHCCMSCSYGANQFNRDSTYLFTQWHALYCTSLTKGSSVSFNYDTNFIKFLLIVTKKIKISFAYDTNFIQLGAEKLLTLVPSNLFQFIVTHSKVGNHDFGVSCTALMRTREKVYCNQLCCFSSVEQPPEGSLDHSP